MSEEGPVHKNCQNTVNQSEPHNHVNFVSNKLYQQKTNLVIRTSIPIAYRSVAPFNSIAVSVLRISFQTIGFNKHTSSDDTNDHNSVFSHIEPDDIIIPDTP